MFSTHHYGTSIFAGHRKYFRCRIHVFHPISQGGSLYMPIRSRGSTLSYNRRNRVFHTGYYLLQFTIIPIISKDTIRSRVLSGTQNKMPRPCGCISMFVMSIRKVISMIHHPSKPTSVKRFVLFQ